MVILNLFQDLSAEKDKKRLAARCWNKLTLFDLLTLGTVQASLALLSLNRKFQHDIWRHLLFILSFLVKPIQFFCLWERSEHRVRTHMEILVTATLSMCQEKYLHFHFLCRMQLENWQSLVAKILFSSWKIFVSQLENYFFPVGHFFLVF